jgi:undecaprenyl-diphosphatase
MNMKSLLDIDYRLSKDLGVAEKPGFLRGIAVFFAHSGDSWFWGLAMIIVWLIGSSFWKQWALVVLGAISVMAPLVLALKFRIRRRRPDGLWGMIYRRTDPHSFPSGHAARSFLIAVLATGLGPVWLALLLWIWAPLVSVARVAMGVHYISDVLGGLVLGVLAGLLVLHLLPPILAFFAVSIPWLW